jgi:O-antigen/teichoic acid export membrane protein
LSVEPGTAGSLRFSESRVESGAKATLFSKGGEKTVLVLKDPAVSRFRRVIHGVASGYVLLAATAVYSLATVPLALHYLSSERFGLLTLLSSIGGYLALIDLGMSGSVARLLVDHKDDRQGGVYGGLIQTGWLVLLVQGTLVFMAAFILAAPLTSVLAIQADLRHQFIVLLRWQGATWALGFWMRICSHLLQAHQRIDLVNYGQLTALAVNFAALWFFLYAGLSMAWAYLAGTAANAGLALAACWHLKLFPGPGAWGRPSWPRFHELFNYGKDLFLVSLGTQLIMASQTLIITRRLGLAVAAAWFAGTRAFTLVNQAIWRISDFSMPAFSEMMVRGEKELLCQRYKAVLVLSASLSGFAAVTYALCNSSFVSVWIPPDRHIYWPASNDVLLGVWMVVLAVLHCHSSFVLITKGIGFMRYVYFVEGLVFVASAVALAPWGGLAAIIACSVICSLLFSGAYGVRRVSLVFDLPFREVALRWLAPLGRVLAYFLPFALAGWWGFKQLQSPWVRLALSLVLSGSFGVYAFLRYGISQPVQSELLSRAPRQLNPVLKRIFLPQPP